jgi:hypothetical protein
VALEALKALDQAKKAAMAALVFSRQLLQQAEAVAVDITHKDKPITADLAAAPVQQASATHSALVHQGKVLTVETEQA